MTPHNVLILALRLSALPDVLHNSCNLGTRDLPDMYGWHTYKANCECPCYNYKKENLYFYSQYKSHK